MQAIQKINETELSVKEYRNQRVVTFKDIDVVHGRPEGTARRNFNNNKKHFIEGEDFFVRNSSEAKTEFGAVAPNGLVLFTESGYLMLVKSFTDDLAWDVQRELVKKYFRGNNHDDSGSVVRIYNNNGWGVMLMDNEVYNLTPKEMEAVARLIPGMKKKGIKEIKLVLEAFLEYSERGSKLKEMASWGIDNPEKPKTQEDEPGYILNLTAKQAQSRYGISRDKLNEIAEEAQAVVDIGNRKLYNREIIDEYFREAAKKQAQITAEGGECK